MNNLDLPAYLKNSRLLNHLTIQRLLKYWAYICIVAVVGLSLTALITHDIVSTHQQKLDSKYIPLSDTTQNLEYILSNFENRLESFEKGKISGNVVDLEEANLLYQRTRERLDLLNERTLDEKPIRTEIMHLREAFAELVANDRELMEKFVPAVSASEYETVSRDFRDLLIKQGYKVHETLSVLRQVAWYFNQQLKSFSAKSRLISEINLMTVLAVSLAVITIIMAGISLIVYRINLPLEKLKGAMRDLSMGQLSRRLTLDGRFVDEFSELSADFNRFAERNQDLFENVEKSRNALQKRERHIRAILDNTLVGIAHIIDNRIVAVNPKFQELFCYDEKEVQQLRKEQLFSSSKEFQDLDSTISELLFTGDTYHAERLMKDKQGKTFWCAVSAKSLAADDHKRGEIWIFEDITQRKEAEEELLQLANYDSLTGLPNRALFRDRLQQGIGRTNRKSGMLGLMYVDLDHFKRVNDSFGHSIGDRLLIEVADRITNCLRDSDTACRLHGDEFSIILPEIQDISDAGKVAEKLIEDMSEPFHLDGEEVNVTLSIGISIYPDNGQDVETLLKNADSAAYHVKARGRNNYQYYTQAMNIKARDRLDRENRLRHAVEDNALMLYYQPQIDCYDMRITGYEALLRWHDPELGMIPPSEFIPILEETGLIVKVGEWIIRQTCEDIPRIAEMNPDFHHLSINFSLRQFADNLIVDKIMKIIESSDISPEQLVIEITESIMMTDTQRSLQILTELSERGLRLSLDDFGTGYSSLSYLKQFPISFIKVDKSFVSDLQVNQSDKAICEAIIAMAKQLDLQVVAEGVESHQQFNFLRESGCHTVQGFLFGKAEPLERLLTTVPLPPPADLQSTL